MHEVKIKTFERVFEKQKELLVKEIETSFNSIDEIGDESDEDIALNFTLTGVRIELLRREDLTIKRLERALLKINKSSFGLCENCGQPIEERSLHSQPLLSFCISCQSS